MGDDAFRSAFEEKAFRTTQSRNKKVVRYIFCEIEHQKTGVRCDFDDISFNIEHILPENPSDGGWGQFSDEEYEAYVYRLGNMTLLNASQNRDLQNAIYDSKRAVLSQSQFKITQELASDATVWNANSINVRQRKMAQIATGIWKVSQLS